MKVLIGNNPMGIETAIPELKKKFPRVDFAHVPERSRTGEMIGDADVYFGWLDRETFLAAKRLRWIQSMSTGVNYYTAIEELVESDVILTGARGTHSVCVAESAIAMILAITRGVAESVRRRGERAWMVRDLRPQLVELTGSTLGVVGYGSIGRAVADRLKAFGMRVLALDLQEPPDLGAADEFRPLGELKSLLAESDYVVVTVPYVPENEALIGPEEIAAMKPSAVLVGVSRGGIIDQEAMVSALREGRLKAAALDVFDPEPLPPESELWDVENLLITTHIAGGSQLEGRHLVEIFSENLERFLAGKFPLRNQIDKVRGF